MNAHPFYSQTHKPVIVELASQVRPEIRVHGSPLPGVGITHVSGSPFSAMHTASPSFGHVHVGGPVSEPSAAAHVPSGQPQLGSSGGHAQPVPSHVHPLALPHAPAVV